MNSVNQSECSIELIEIENKRRQCYKTAPGIEYD